MDGDDAGELAARALGDEETVLDVLEAQQPLADLRLGRRVAQLRAEGRHGRGVGGAAGADAWLRLVHGG